MVPAPPQRHPDPMTANAHTSNPTTTDNTLDGARAWFAEHGLSRSPDDRLIAGVSGAFARRFRVNPFLARVITVAAAIGFTPLAYVALWVLMPSE
jgi:phage shock protein PspC (stress-responsive transcriptional regulator)